MPYNDKSGKEELVLGRHILHVRGERATSTAIEKRNLFGKDWGPLEKPAQSATAESFLN